LKISLLSLSYNKVASNDEARDKAVSI
jgi:hypothetical protein